MSGWILVPAHVRLRLFLRFFNCLRCLILLFERLIDHHVVHVSLEAREQFALLNVLNRRRRFVIGNWLNCGSRTSFATLLFECFKDFGLKVHLKLVADDLALALRLVPHFANVFSRQSSLGHDTLKLGQLDQKSI